MIAILASLLLAVGAEPEGKKCRIDVRVIKTAPNAPRSEQRETVVAEPRIVTEFGRPAVFRIGQFGPAISGITGPSVETLTFGFEIATQSMLGPDGSIRLTMEVVSPGRAGRGPRIDVHVHLPPGKTHRFRTEADGGAFWIEVAAAPAPAEK